MGGTVNPTVSRRRLGSELRRLREGSGTTTQQVAARLLISQPKISLMENGRRLIKPRDVRDLCGLYGVRDQRRVDHLMQLAGESGRQGWWNAYDDISYGAYIGLEAEAAAIRFYDPLVIAACSKPRYSDMYAHMQARALSPDMTRNFIEEAGKEYAGTELRPDA